MQDMRGSTQIDPQMQAILRQTAVIGRKPFSTLTPSQARAWFDPGFTMLGRERKEVSKIEDRKFRGPAGEIPVRIYTPFGKGPFGGLIYFHGGAFVVGNLDTHDAICRDLTAGAGCVTISVDYRLAPEHKFPAAPEDCYAATRCAYDIGKHFNVDPNRIAVGGDSAGGNLAAVVAQMARDRRCPRIVFQLLMYPVTDAVNETPSQREFKDEFTISKADVDWSYGHYLSDTDRMNPYASPGLAKSFVGLPSAYVLTAEFDPLRDEGEAYAEVLRRASVKVKLKRYEGVCHGFVSFASVLDVGKRAIADCCAELRASIGGQRL
jgi:acetyl esterase